MRRPLKRGHAQNDAVQEDPHVGDRCPVADVSEMDGRLLRSSKGSDSDTQWQERVVISLHVVSGRVALNMLSAPV